MKSNESGSSYLRICANIRWGNQNQNKTQLSFGGLALCSMGFHCWVSVLGTNLYQCSSGWLLWEATFSFSEQFLKTLSTPFPISWWMICEHTCPHCAECWAVFDQKWHNPCASPSLFIQSRPKWLFFCFPGWKKSPKGNGLPMWKKWNKKWQKH